MAFNEESRVSMPLINKSNEGNILVSLGETGFETINFHITHR